MAEVNEKGGWLMGESTNVPEPELVRGRRVRSKRRRIVLGILGVASVLIASGVTHFIALGWFTLGTCPVWDTSGPYAASSTLGRMCDLDWDYHGWLTWLPVGMLGASALLVPALVLLVRAWRRSLMWIPLVLLVLAPAVEVDVLGAQDRWCSPGQQHELHAHCRSNQ